jgi:hypothetical protein
MNKDNVNIDSDFWVGIVEDNSNDPLKIGQCRIRIIGTHSFDGTELPTEALPWAIPSIPLNGSKTISVPNVGDWVFGYFLDGKNKQMPVILGIMPGLVNNTSYVKLTGQQKREYLQKLADQPVPAKTIKTAETEVPGEIAPQQGEPTTPKVSRGEVVGTTISIMNSLKSHSCDISFLTKKQVSSAKTVVKNIVVVLRKAVKAILDAIGISPGSSAIKSMLEHITKTLKSINKFMNDIILELNKIVEVVRDISRVIEYILSLPADIAAYFTDCLNKLYNLISSTAFDIISGGVAEGSDVVGIDVSSVTSEVQNILSETNTLLNNAATIYAGPVSVVESLFQPSAMTDAQVEELFSKAYDGFSKFNQSNYQPVLV